MLYNYEKDLKSAEERIKSSGISEANKQLIFEFESNCFAEGLRISRTLHLTELKVFTEMFGKELKDASKLDILKMIERIERMDRSDRMVDGKTGMRRVRIIFSSPYLATWLETHPFRDNPESFVWVGIGTVGRNVPMRYDAIRMHLKRIATRAGIKKRIHPHLFRHSRSTHLAKHLIEYSA